MELLRTIAYPPGGGGGGAKCCEGAPGRAAGGESRRKKAEEQPHQHHNAHHAAEVSRIITDPTTGKRYCRGKVLGKVMAAAATRGEVWCVCAPRPGRPSSAERGAERRSGRCVGRAGPLLSEGCRSAPRCRLPPAQPRVGFAPALPRSRRSGSEHPSSPRFISAPKYRRNRAFSSGEPTKTTLGLHAGRGGTAARTSRYAMKPRPVFYQIVLCEGSCAP